MTQIHFDKVDNINMRFFCPFKIIVSKFKHNFGIVEFKNYQLKERREGKKKVSYII